MAAATLHLMTQQSTHESLAREEQDAPGSERLFAIVMTVVLGVLGAVNWWHDGRVWPWLIGIAALFVVSGYFCPVALKPLNWLWFKFGLFLHGVINPIVMGLVFYGAVLPTGLVMRAMGKDPLQRNFEPERESYWIVRHPPGPAPQTMKKQF